MYYEISALLLQSLSLMLIFNKQTKVKVWLPNKLSVALLYLEMTYLFISHFFFCHSQEFFTYTTTANIIDGGNHARCGGNPGPSAGCFPCTAGEELTAIALLSGSWVRALC